MQPASIKQQKDNTRETISLAFGALYTLATLHGIPEATIRQHEYAIADAIMKQRQKNALQLVEFRAK